MTELILKYIAPLLLVGGVVVWISYVLKRVPVLEKNQENLSNKVDKNSEGIVAMKESIKYITKTMDSISDTIKDQHEQDRLLMIKLIDKIK